MEKLTVPATERRRKTRNRIYRFIYSSAEPVTKPQIAEGVGISQPAVQPNLAELLEAGVVLEGELQKSTGGRPPIGYYVDAKSKYSIGAAVSANHIRIVILDLKGKEAASDIVWISELDLNRIAEMLQMRIYALTEKYGIPQERLLGLGVTFPGIISEDERYIVQSPTLNMQNVDLGGFKSRFELPVFIENDGSAAAQVEITAAENRTALRNFTYLFLENGVGGAVVVNGREMRGEHNRCGEFGHMILVPNGKPCSCGRNGCAEAYLSTKRISTDFAVSLEEFFSILERGRRPAFAEVWEDLLYYLALAIHNLHMAFDTEVVLGGMLTEFLPPYLGVLREKLKRLDQSEDCETYLHITKCPHYAGMIGAAGHFIRQYIHSL